MSFPSRVLLVAALLVAGAAAAGCESDAAQGAATTKAAVAATPALYTFAVYAERSLTLEPAATITGGGVGIAAVSANTTRAQLILGRGAGVDPSQVTFAPTVTLEPESIIGHVNANVVQNLGATTVGTVSPYYDVIEALPSIALSRPLAATGGTDVDVADGATTLLPPGSYGNLTVSGTIFLSLGAYSFISVSLGTGAHLFSTAATDCNDIEIRCTTTIQVANTLTIGEYATLEAIYATYPTTTNPMPSNGGPSDSFALQVTVSGNDLATASPAANIRPNARVNGLLAAPNGSLDFGEHVLAVGAFSAFDVVIGPSAHVFYESGFPNQPQGEQQLSGYFGASPFAPVAPIVGPLPSSTVIMLDIGLPARVHNDRSLRESVATVSDPLHYPSTYRHYYTPAAFAESFGAAPEDYAALQGWATSYGLQIDHTVPTNLLLSVSGTVAQLEQALYANLVLRQRPDGSSFVTVDRDPSLDLEPTNVLWISGLDDFWPLRASVNGSTNGNFCPSNGSTAFDSNDLRAAYLQNHVACPAGTTNVACTSASGSGCTTATSATPCGNLTGNGQVVGIFSYVPPVLADFVGYDNQQNNPGNSIVDQVGSQSHGGPAIIASLSKTETSLDVEMVQSMAPNAQIIVFSEIPASNLFNIGHVNAAFHDMANSSPTLTVASTSWQFGRDQNEQQALDQMAMEGVSFFQASGDYGNIEDPQDARDLDAQTLVGGTFLTTAFQANVCSEEAYVRENTWNGGTSGGDISGGGIMDGTQNLSNTPYPATWISALLTAFGAAGLGGEALNVQECDCYPYPFCCGPGVPTPIYQAPLVNASNGGSTKYRNYPDVSMVASNLGEYAQGGCTTNGGTSGSAPLWAGFMALTNELSELNGAGTIGFANPALYEIGQTRGQAVNDLYSQDFNDIADGVANSVSGGGGYLAVPGYDLATGLGTPTCNLMFQLATTTPLTGNTPLYWLDFVITTGDDDLGEQTGAIAEVRFHNGAEIGIDLKQGAGVGGATKGAHWNNGSSVSIPVNLAQLLPPAQIPTLNTGGIDWIIIKSVQASGSIEETFDNWDIGGLNVRLAANPGGDVQEACQFDLRGVYTLEDHSLGVVRLSESCCSHGVGNQIAFATPEAASMFPPGVVYPAQYDSSVNGLSNCTSTGHPLDNKGQDTQPGIQFIFDTGNDGLRSDSGLVANLFRAGNQTATIQLKTGGSVWNSYTQQNIVYPLEEPFPDQININIQQHDHGLETDDGWNVDGINIMRWNVGGPEICFFKQYQSTTEAANSGSDGRVLRVKDNTLTLRVTNCAAVE